MKTPPFPEWLGGGVLSIWKVERVQVVGLPWRFGKIWFKLMAIIEATTTGALPKMVVTQSGKR